MWEVKYYRVVVIEVVKRSFGMGLVCEIWKEFGYNYEKA